MHDGGKKAPEVVALSVILPAYNEADNLEAVVGELRAALQALPVASEIIVVDDGSRDGTAAVADRLAGAHGVRVITHDHNRGYGAALRSGFAAAGRDWVFFMDSDGQLDPADLAAFLPHLTDHDLVAGFRLRRMDPLHRRLYGRLFTLTARVLFGVTSRDVNCAFKLIRRSRLEQCRLTADGALINVELLWELKKLGVGPLELPVAHRPRRSGLQTGGSGRVILRAAAELFRLRFLKG